MRVLVADEAQLGLIAARVVLDELEAGRLGALGVATGSSPLPVYAALAAAGADWSGVSAFALDEYLGIAPGHPESYRSVIHREVTARLGLDPALVHVPDGAAADPRGACAAYEEALHAVGGVDVQILGIGANGHIGFNEPGSRLDSRTRVVALTARTRADNARFFPAADEVPTHAMTQGIATIATARRHLLIAQGAAKADAVRLALTGPVGPACPASVLQTLSDVTVVLDEQAAAGLAERPEGEASSFSLTRAVLR